MWPVPAALPGHRRPAEPLADLPPGQRVRRARRLVLGRLRPGRPHRAAHERLRAVGARLPAPARGAVRARPDRRHVRRRHQRRRHDGTPVQRASPRRSSRCPTRTRLVTLTIGGNDADLFGTAASCLAISADGPVFSGPRRAVVREHARAGRRRPARREDPVARRTRHRGHPRQRCSGPRRTPSSCSSGTRRSSPTPSTPPRRAASDRRSTSARWRVRSPRTPTRSPTTTSSTCTGSRTSSTRSPQSAADAAGVRFVDVFESTQAHSACAPRRRSATSPVSP